MAMPSVLISEVGPRDGLQSVSRTMPTEHKLAWIDALYAAGLREIEVGSFVPAALLPQMADVADVVRHALTLPGLAEDLVFRFEAMGINTGIDIERLIATRAPLKAGLPGEPIYGMSPEAGLPLGFARRQSGGPNPVPTLTRPSPASGRGF